MGFDKPLIIDGTLQEHEDEALCGADCSVNQQVQAKGVVLPFDFPLQLLVATENAFYELYIHSNDTCRNSKNEPDADCLLRTAHSDNEFLLLIARFGWRSWSNLVGSHIPTK